MKILIHWLISALAIFVTSYFLPGVQIKGFAAALVLALVLGIINVVLRPILIALTLPVTVVSLGLFVLFINAFLIMLASYIVPGFAIDSFWSAFLFGIVLALVNFIFRIFEKSTIV